MRLRQYNLGKWLGFYYSELQNSLSIVGIVNSLVNLSVLWAVASKTIVIWFPWLNYPLFMGIVFATVMIVLPLADYTLIYKTRQTFLNEQGWKHGNPVKVQLDRMESAIVMLMKKNNVDDTEIEKYLKEIKETDAGNRQK